MLERGLISQFRKLIWEYSNCAPRTSNLQLHELAILYGNEKKWIFGFWLRYCSIEDDRRARRNVWPLAAQKDRQGQVLLWQTPCVSYAERKQSKYFIFQTHCAFYFYFCKKIPLAVSQYSSYCSVECPCEQEFDFPTEDISAQCKRYMVSEICLQIPIIKMCRGMCRILIKLSLVRCDMSGAESKRQERVFSQSSKSWWTVVSTRRTISL